jgi:predicted nucleic acid-binding Zn finger protein
MSLTVTATNTTPSKSEERRKKAGFKLWKNDSVQMVQNFFLVRSARDDSIFYTIEMGKCDCMDYILRNTKCKHIYAVEYFLKGDPNEKGINNSHEGV